ncbi:MAG: DUF2510 domain-containing protein [Candidatus Nanopelagicales bacterium]
MSTPAGWYDDGSGRVRWWDGQQWTGQVQMANNKLPGSASHLCWALSPAYCCGLVAFIPALHAAIKLQRRDLWFWAVGLIVGNIIAWSLMLSSPSNPDGRSTPIQDVGVAITLVLAVTGTIQAFLTREAVFAESHTAAANPLAGASIQLDPAVANSLAARKRRAESVALSINDPSLARDLMIGRPDLSRQYYDGGLVDVNHVPAAVLVSHLGFSHDQARTVIEARDQIEGFVSADDLCSLANVPQHMLDAMRDRIVTL